MCCKNIWERIKDFITEMSKEFMFKVYFLKINKTTETIIIFSTLTEHNHAKNCLTDVQ